MDAGPIQTEMARLRIDDRLVEAERVRLAMRVHSPRRPRALATRVLPDVRRTPTRAGQRIGWILP